MKKDLLYRHVTDHLKSIEKHLGAYSKDKKPKQLHLLRLDIKITKALLSFAEAVYKNSYSTVELKPLFQKAGEIREIQIMIQLISSSDHRPKELIHQLKKKERFLKQQFVNNISLYRKSMQHFRKGISLPSKLPDEQTIKTYFDAEWMIANQKFETKDREGLHQLRKGIKKLMFVYDALPKKIRKEVELNKEAIDKLQEKVGRWHDTYAAIDFLSRQNFSQNLGDHISNLEDKERKQFNKLLNH
jgi:CHAD domain-containing protein